MGRRLDLQGVLEDILGSGNVYFQPPENVQMSYPAIVYNRDYQVSEFADNRPYSRTLRYQITVIDKDPDSLIPDKVAEMPMATFVRHFTSDNLNHDIYDVYF
jgi:hypothetical protein